MLLLVIEQLLDNPTMYYPLRLQNEEVVLATTKTFIHHTVELDELDHALLPEEVETVELDEPGHVLLPEDVEKVEEARTTLKDTTPTSIEAVAKSQGCTGNCTLTSYVTSHMYYIQTYHIQWYHDIAQSRTVGQLF